MSKNISFEKKNLSAYEHRNLSADVPGSLSADERTNLSACVSGKLSSGRHSKTRPFTAAFICIAVALIGISQPAFTAVNAEAATVKDYTIAGAEWCEGSEGSLYGTWDKPETGSKYKVTLYKGTYKSHKLVNEYSVGTCQCDFSQKIYANGAGTYYFTVYPVSGGTEYAISSEEYEIDSDAFTVLRAYIKAKGTAGTGKTTVSVSNNATLNNGDTYTPQWVQDPDGSWSYHTDYKTYLKNQWIETDGKQYYVGPDGRMLTGWQVINSKWYYLGTDGAKWVNATTPDGYYVNADGEYVSADTGTVQTVSQTGYTKNSRLLSSINISVNEDKDTAAGVIRNIKDITATSGVEITGYTLGTDYSKWSIGTSVKITVKIAAKEGYQFNTVLKTSASNASISNTTGSGNERVVVLTYYPKMKLKTPSGLYFASGDVLCWKKVPHTNRYRLVVYYDNTKYKTKTVEDTSYDVSEYIDGPEDDPNYDDIIYYVDEDEEESTIVSFTVTALAPSSKSSSYYTESDAAKVYASDRDVESDTDSGTFYVAADGSIKYTDSNGDPIKGWQFVKGAWYYFDSKGYAKDQGWFRDSDYKCWFYIGADHKMQTGWIQDGGYTYYLRESVDDGNSSNTPVGGMLTGVINWNGAQYNLNADATNGIPLGAWLQ